MATLPRTDDFSLLAGGIPSDGAGWVLGDHVETDKAVEEYGQATAWRTREFGVAATDDDVQASAWMAWRNEAPAGNVRVSGQFLWRHVSGSRRDVRLGLMARLQNVSGTASGPPEHWFEGDAYYLEVEIDAELETAAYVLRRAVQGVVTDLGELSEVSWPEGRSKDLELRVVTRTDGSVKLEVLEAGDQVLRLVDPADDAVTGPGYFGFETSDGHDTGGQTRSSIRWFAAKENNGDVILEDNFDRPNRVDAAPEYYVRSLWGPFAGLEQVSGAIRPTEAFEDYGLITMYQVRPTSADYAVSAGIIYGAGNPHWGGVVARASKASTGTNLSGFTGYLARLRIDVSTDNLELLKVIGGTLISTSKASVSGLTAGPLITVGLEVSGTVEVTVVVSVNGVDQLTLTDVVESRVQRAGQAGIYLFSATTSPGVRATSFELADPPAADDTVTVRAVLDERVPEVTRLFAIVDLTDQIDGVADTFTLPYQPAGDGSVALFHGGLRKRWKDSTPGDDEYSVDASGLSVTTGWVPEAGERVFAEYPLVGNASYRINERPTGTYDGSNATFTLAYIPTSKPAVRAFVNGVRLKYSTASSLQPWEYSMPTSTRLVVGTAPDAEGDLVVDYPRASAAPTNPVFGEVPTGGIDGTNRGFLLSRVPNSSGETAPFLNGYRLSPASGHPEETEFALSGKRISVGDTPQTGEDWLVVDCIRADYFPATLELPPDLPFAVTEQYSTLSAEFEYDYEQAIALQAQGRCSYPVRASALTLDEAEEVLEFLRAHKGAYRQFQWTPPDADEPVTVHMARGSFKSRKVAPDVYDVEFVLEQLIAFTSVAA